jgi:hypothetical protein
VKYKASAKELALYPVVDGILYIGVRELCLTHTGYANRIIEMADRQGWFCALCPRRMTHPTFEHEKAKGMGGVSQDDGLLHADGKTWKNASAHADCNSKKGSRQYHWVDGNKFYIPAVYSTIEEFIAAEGK